MQKILRERHVLFTDPAQKEKSPARFHRNSVVLTFCTWETRTTRPAPPLDRAQVHTTRTSVLSFRTQRRISTLLRYFQDTRIWPFFQRNATTPEFGRIHNGTQGVACPGVTLKNASFWTLSLWSILFLSARFSFFLGTRRCN